MLVLTSVKPTFNIASDIFIRLSCIGLNLLLTRVVPGLQLTGKDVFLLVLTQSDRNQWAIGEPLCMMAFLNKPTM